MRNRPFLLILAILLFVCPDLRADNVTLSANKAKASFSFSGGKIKFDHDNLMGDSNFKHYSGTIRPGETINLSLKALEGYGPDEGIGANQANISVSVAMKGSCVVVPAFRVPGHLARLSDCNPGPYHLLHPIRRAQRDAETAPDEPQYL